MTHIRYSQDIDDTCPNCDEAADQTGTEDESHWTVAYLYKCSNCGTEFNWSKAEQDGLTGWALTVDWWGDASKAVDGSDHPDAGDDE